MTEGLGHDFNEYYICHRCRVTEYDALMGKIVCPGNDEPLIVDETIGLIRPIDLKPEKPVDLSKIIAGYREMRDRLKEKKWVGAWESSLAVQQEFINLLRMTGLQSASFDEAQVNELKALHCECRDLAKDTPAEAWVEKIGDGTFLKLLFQLFEKLLPILIPIFMP